MKDKFRVNEEKRWISRLAEAKTTYDEDKTKNVLVLKFKSLQNEENKDVWKIKNIDYLENKCLYKYLLTLSVFLAIISGLRGMLLLLRTET